METTQEFRRRDRNPWIFVGTAAGTAIVTYTAWFLSDYINFFYLGQADSIEGMVLVASSLISTTLVLKGLSRCWERRRSVGYFVLAFSTPAILTWALYALLAGLYSAGELTRLFRLW